MLYYQEAAERFVKNLKNEQKKLEKNIKNITKKIQDKEQVALNSGYLHLLQEKQKRNKKMQKEAEKQFEDIIGLKDKEVEEEHVIVSSNDDLNNDEIDEIVELDDIEVEDEEDKMLIEDIFSEINDLFIDI